MDLEHFIAESLKQIIDGARSAQEHAREQGHGAKVNPFVKGITGASYIKDVEFDVAVTIVQDDKKKKGGGLRVAGLVIGAEGEAASTHESVSRIRFSIPVVLSRADK